MIDDNVVELKKMLEMLRSSGYRLSIATDALQGYRRATAQQIDLVLLDVSMGTVDGFAVCRLLKANTVTADIPVIFVSSRTQLQERLLGLRSGAVDYILKPFEPAEVLARIEIHLALSKRYKTQNSYSTTLQDQKDHSTPIKNLAENPDTTLLQAAKNIIFKDLAHIPLIPELATQLGTNEKRLTRVFQTQTGRTVYKFIREARLHEARRLLLESVMRIDEIAVAIGFSNAANFSTAFHAHFGCTPSSFRSSKMN